MVNEIDPARLRRLAGLATEGAKVLSIYVDLDPAQFGTVPARDHEIASLLDRAHRCVEDSGLGHDALVAAREDVQRAREFFSGGGFDPSDARAVALFACGPAGLFEAVRLPRPVQSTVELADAPWIEPLTRAAAEPRVAVALVDRHAARLFVGARDGLEELDPESAGLRIPKDSSIPHERRHQRASGEEVVEHFQRVGHALLSLLKTRGFDVLALGVRSEERSELVEHLHPYVRERLGGEVRVDIGSATTTDVAREAARVVDEVREREVHEALERLRTGVGRGERAAAGPEDVLAALNERRVEILLYESRVPVPGVVCPVDGWLGAGGVSSCPVDGTTVEPCDDIRERAAESAVLQDARVLALGDEREDLGPLGHMGAVLRF